MDVFGWVGGTFFYCSTFFHIPADLPFSLDLFIHFSWSASAFIWGIHNFNQFICSPQTHASFFSWPMVRIGHKFDLYFLVISLPSSCSSWWHHLLTCGWINFLFTRLHIERIPWSAAGENVTRVLFLKLKISNLFAMDSKHEHYFPLPFKSCRYIFWPFHTTFCFKDSSLRLKIVVTTSANIAFRLVDVSPKFAPVLHSSPSIRKVVLIFKHRLRRKKLEKLQITYRWLFFRRTRCRLDDCISLANHLFFTFDHTQKKFPKLFWLPFVNFSCFFVQKCNGVQVFTPCVKQQKVITEEKPVRPRRSYHSKTYFSYSRNWFSHALTFPIVSYRLFPYWFGMFCGRMHTHWALVIFLVHFPLRYNCHHYDRQHFSLHFHAFFVLLSNAFTVCISHPKHVRLKRKEFAMLLNFEC